MSFGGSAAAANAAIKRNAALRGRKSFLNGVRRAYPSAPAVKQTASSAVRKQFSEALREGLARDRRRNLVISLLTTFAVMALLMYFLG